MEHAVFVSPQTRHAVLHSSPSAWPVRPPAWLDRRALACPRATKATCIPSNLQNTRWALLSARANAVATPVKQLSTHLGNNGTGIVLDLVPHTRPQQLLSMPSANGNGSSNSSGSSSHGNSATNGSSGSSGISGSSNSNHGDDSLPSTSDSCSSSSQGRSAVSNRRSPGGHATTAYLDDMHRQQQQHQQHHLDKQHHQLLQHRLQLQQLQLEQEAELRSNGGRDNRAALFLAQPLEDRGMASPSSDSYVVAHEGSRPTTQPETSSSHSSDAATSRQHSRQVANGSSSTGNGQSCGWQSSTYRSGRRRRGSSSSSSSCQSSLDEDSQSPTRLSPGVRTHADAKLSSSSADLAACTAQAALEEDGIDAGQSTSSHTAVQPSSTRAHRKTYVVSSSSSVRSGAALLCQHVAKGDHIAVSANASVLQKAAEIMALARLQLLNSQAMDLLFQPLLTFPRGSGVAGSGFEHHWVASAGCSTSSGNGRHHDHHMSSSTTTNGSSSNDARTSSCSGSGSSSSSSSHNSMRPVRGGAWSQPKVGNSLGGRYLFIGHVRPAQGRFVDNSLTIGSSKQRTVPALARQVRERLRSHAHTTFTGLRHPAELEAAMAALAQCHLRRDAGGLGEDLLMCPDLSLNSDSSGRSVVAVELYAEQFRL